MTAVRRKIPNAKTPFSDFISTLLCHELAAGMLTNHFDASGLQQKTCYSLPAAAFFIPSSRALMSGGFSSRHLTVSYSTTLT
jgi:hypothetical protein